MRNWVVVACGELRVLPRRPGLAGCRVFRHSLFVTGNIVVLEHPEQRSAACEYRGLGRLLCRFPMLVEWWMGLGCPGEGMAGEGWIGS